MSGAILPLHLNGFRMSKQKSYIYILIIHISYPDKISAHRCKRVKMIDKTQALLKKGLSSRNWIVHKVLASYTMTYQRKFGL